MNVLSEAELLTSEELAEVTGYKLPGSQRRWLDKNGWPYVLNAAGRPIVGRWFARLRLAGVQPSEATAGPAVIESGWKPDFSSL